MHISIYIYIYTYNYIDDDKKKSKKELVDTKKTDKPDKSPKNAQNAHEAIRPAEAEGRFKTPDETLLSGEKKLLYGLIYRRTLASVMKPSVAFTKTYTIETNDDAIPGVNSLQGLFQSASFRSSETVTTFQGFKAALTMPDDGSHTHDDADPLKSMRNLYVGKVVVLTEDQPEEELGEELDEGENDGSRMNNEDEKDGKDDGEGTAEVNPEDGEVASSVLSKGGIIAMQHVTRPPSRFSQASFIKELEIIGVGRPSTYAKIFQILKERGYVHVDGQTLIPTLKGLIVAAWLAKHFPDLVEPQFTASMEDSLDRISQGTEEKQKFLSDFYLGNPGEENSGLLSRVAQKLLKQEIDHKESRTLSIPFLKDVGVVQLGSSGAFIESKLSPQTSLRGGTIILDSDLNNAISLIEGEVMGKGGEEGGKYLPKTTRWKLPEAMQIDIRQVTKEAVELVMATETTMQGFNVGEDPITGRPVILRSGRFGRYMQIGLDSEKNRSTHSVPQWLETTASLMEIMAFSSLPKVMCVHPVLGLPIVMDVANKQLCVGIEGYPVRIPLPEGTLVSAVTDELAISLLSDTNAILESQRNLGVWNEEDVVVKQGRFGYYVRCGKLIAGLRQVDPATLVLEAAIEILQTRGKLMGSKKKKGKDKKVTKKTSTIKKLSGYQIFISEVMKGGLKMGEAGVKWKALDNDSQEVYRARALEVVKGGSSSSSIVDKPVINKKKKNPTGYQIYVSEIMKMGVKMADAATRWKELDINIQQTYKDKSTSLALLSSEGM
jgi:topoisomerase IA-like protein